MMSIWIISAGSIDGRPLRIVRYQLGVQPTQIKNGSNLAYRMIVRHQKLS
jgi:hypothetical protein